MPTPRSQQISLADRPFYHICSRTVRKAFLCAVDKETGGSFEHRRTWIEKRIFQLAHVFATDLTLVDETGRILQDDKRGVINLKTANILARLHISHQS